MSCEYYKLLKRKEWHFEKLALASRQRKKSGTSYKEGLEESRNILIHYLALVSSKLCYTFAWRKN